MTFIAKPIRSGTQGEDGGRIQGPLPHPYPQPLHVEGRSYIHKNLFLHDLGACSEVSFHLIKGFICKINKIKTTVKRQCVPTLEAKLLIDLLRDGKWISNSALRKESLTGLFGNTWLSP